MSDTGQGQVDEIRRTAQQILERLETDPAFQAQVQQDPQAALEAAGLNQEAARCLLRDRAMGAYAPADIQSVEPACTLTLIRTCIVNSD